MVYRWSPIFASPWFLQSSLLVGTQIFLDVLATFATCTLFFRPLVVKSAHRFSFSDTKLQPRFRDNHVLQCFSRFETNFFMDVLSNFATAKMSETTLVVESAHRLSHLLSHLRICKNQVRPLLENSRGRVCDSLVFLRVDPTRVP